MLVLRMGGEIAHCKEEEEEKDVLKDRELKEVKMVAQMRYSAAAISGGFSPPSTTMKVVVVGYALTSKKIKSFLQPKLEGLARNKGILFVAIDLSKPFQIKVPLTLCYISCLEKNGVAYLRIIG